MSDTYEINESNQVVPYTSGRKCTDTRAWRDATDLELQQQEQIEQLERELAEVTKQRDTLVEALHSIRHRLGDFQEPWNSRESYIDTIAHQAIAAVEGGSHE